MSTSKRITRRKAITSGLGAAAAGMSLPLFVSCRDRRKIVPGPEEGGSQEKTPGANDQIAVGIIGCGSRAAQLLSGKGGQGKPPKEARIVAVSDVNLVRARQWAEKYDADPYQDYRKMLERKDIDVILCATPEHWHYLPCIHSVQAGKDVYGEQPLSHSIREGRVMADAVRKHERVFQTGEQQRSHPKIRQAVELIINGRIGKIKEVIGWNYSSPFECNFPGQDVPEGLDWDRWCGQNEVVPYNVNLYLPCVAYEREWKTEAEKSAIGPGWISCRPYSGGELLNSGCQGLSVVQWALGMDTSGPEEIWVEPEEKYVPLVYDKPETAARGDKHGQSPVVKYKFRNGVILSLSETKDKRTGGGVRFIGEKGEITVFRGGYTCNPEDLDAEPLPKHAKRVYKSDDHMQDFFQCVRTRKDPVMDVEKGHRLATLCHLGNIARRLGRPLKWSPALEEFPGDAEANGHIDCPKRKGYELPASV